MEAVARLVHLGEGVVLSTIQTIRPEDRFVDTPDYDPRPALTRAVRQTVRQLVSSTIEAEAIKVAPPLIRSPRNVFLEPPTRIYSATRNGQTLNDVMSPKDPVLRHAFLYARYRYFDPQLSLAEFKRLKTLRSGLYVRRTAGQRWQRGDVVLCAGKRPVTSTFEFARFRRFRPSAPIVFRRNNQTWRLNPHDNTRVPAPATCVR